MVISSSILAAWTSSKVQSGVRQGGGGQEERHKSVDVHQEWPSVNVSQAARDLARAASVTKVGDTAQAIQARLAQIQSKDALSRTEEEMTFLLTHDLKLAEITAKGFEHLTAEEVEYEQKARGLVNTMSQLSASERALLNELKGPEHRGAREGLVQISFLRMASGHMGGGENGTTYDPRSTPITAENILKFLRHSIIDASGLAERQFFALAEYLQERSVVTI